MKVVIVGGSGNISTSIVRRLLEVGHEVTCFTRSGDFPADLEVRSLRGDRNDRSSFETTMREEDFDVAIDMISFTAEDAQSALRAFPGVSQFIQCSTVCTYGDTYEWLPATENHPQRPTTRYGRGKAEADQVLLEAHAATGFPVTILKPSTTYGPQMGLPRQLSIESSWIDRVRHGLPILVCGDGKAIHQFLHVDDAALGFVGAIGKSHCLGQTYHLVNRGFVTWEQYHQTAMTVLDREVDLIGIPLQVLVAVDPERFRICQEIFAHNVYYSSEKIFQDIPEFRPTITLQRGMVQVLEAMDRDGRILDAAQQTWEGPLIRAMMRLPGQLTG